MLRQLAKLTERFFSESKVSTDLSKRMYDRKLTLIKIHENEISEIIFRDYTIRVLQTIFTATTNLIIQFVACWL